jgi:Protein of unknown function (DUF3892)
MANVVYITCRTLASSPCSNRYYHIAQVRWVKDDGQSGSATRQEMVDWLADAINEAYTRAPSGQEARVHTLTCGDHQYIETYPDNTKVDNLRELPNC